MRTLPWFAMNHSLVSNVPFAPSNQSLTGSVAVWRDFTGVT